MPTTAIAASAAVVAGAGVSVAVPVIHSGIGRAPFHVRHRVGAIRVEPFAVGPHGPAPFLDDVQVVRARAEPLHRVVVLVAALQIVGPGRNDHRIDGPILSHAPARLRVVRIERRGGNPIGAMADAGRQTKHGRRDNQGANTHGKIPVCRSKGIINGCKGKAASADFAVAEFAKIQMV